MDFEPLPADTLQPSLFELNEAATGVLELFPAVWSAAEDLISPEAALRHRGLDRLLEMGAARLSPLIAYLLATRLADPSLDFRLRVVSALASLLRPDVEGFVAPEAVRRQLFHTLGQMRTRTIFALLEVLVADAKAENDLARLLNACPYAGKHLADILAERRNPLPIRRAAAQMIGRVGYLDAIPALERLAARLEARLSGQQAMPFAPPAQPDESELYPVIRDVLIRLKAP